ncbi:carboxypeptidase-like regulatory domain-containing protein [uncultured Alistipes sp.]|uniref:carboxypeptidase-like regulatory domain-containing protein n=1 Tax=uncultured Alistipes sp. TaxID=538949 RepID=UPI00262ECBA7|nr:carboxypeptidase-like regulatory domain-containing protein [uncultured Alistipes sp.]
MVLTLLLTVSFSGWLTASAQQRTVTVNGVVLDENGSPMVGVTVVDSKKPTVGTTSGAQGNFAIIVGRDCDSLRFSFIGYIPQTVSVRNAALVRMKPDL